MATKKPVIGVEGIRCGETEIVPVSERKVTFILIKNEVSGIRIICDHTIGGKQEIFKQAKSGDKLLAAWTGQWTTDIFELDIKKSKEIFYKR